MARLTRAQQEQLEAEQKAQRDAETIAAHTDRVLTVLEGASKFDMKISVVKSTNDAHPGWFYVVEFEDHHHNSETLFIPVVCDPDDWYDLPYLEGEVADRKRKADILARKLKLRESAKAKLTEEEQKELGL